MPWIWPLVSSPSASLSQNVRSGSGCIIGSGNTSTTCSRLQITPSVSTSIKKVVVSVKFNVSVLEVSSYKISSPLES